jgi:hypothetical protein
VAAITKLSPLALRRLEMGDFEALPSGVLGRAQVRAFARAVGLDPDEVLKGLADRLPAGVDPVEALRLRARAQFTEAHPVTAALRARAEDWQRRAGEMARTAPRWRPGWTPRGRPVAAAAVDSLVLAAFASVMLVASAWMTSGDVGGVLHLALWPLLVACALMALLYYVLSERLGRSTPGAVIADWLARTIRRAGPRIHRWQVWD